MEAPAADVSARRGLVVASAPRTASLAEAERRLTRCAVVATVVGYAPPLQLREVHRAMAASFRIQEEEMKVSMRATGEYLLIFDDARVRNDAVGRPGALQIDRVSFLLSPWTRFRRASPAALLYKVRVVLEGVSEHVGTRRASPSSSTLPRSLKGLTKKIARRRRRGASSSGFG